MLFRGAISLCLVVVQAGAGCGSGAEPELPPDARASGEADAGKADAAMADAEPVDALPGVRRFEHSLYADPRDCPSDPLFNCFPQLELCPDGRAFLLWTDILNRGTYAETDGVVEATFEAGDVPERINFTLRDGGQALEDDWRSWAWYRTEPEYPFCDL